MAVGRIFGNSPSPPPGVERVGVRRGIPERPPRRLGATHLTLPPLRDGPLPLPPEGRRGAPVREGA